MIPKEPYLKGWNDTIFGNATAVLNAPVKKFVLDGSSGALDTAREIKERVKNLAYAYRMSNNSVYAERIWTELLVSTLNMQCLFQYILRFLLRMQLEMVLLRLEPQATIGIPIISWILPSLQQHSPSVMTGFMIIGPAHVVPHSCGASSHLVLTLVLAYVTGQLTSGA